MYGKEIKRKMCKKSDTDEKNVQKKQKFSKCMTCLNVNEGLEKSCFEKKSSYILENK